MSKYIKLEDMENLIINIAPDGDVFTRGISALQSLPTIDIVHCKDCKFRNNSQRVTKPDGSKMRYKCDCIGVYMFDDNFCSYGERKEE